MKQIYTSDKIELQVEYLEIVNYAMLLNGGRVISDIYVRNIGNAALDNVSIRIEGFYFPATDLKIGSLEPNETLKEEVSNVMPDLMRLLQLNEAVFTEFKVTVNAEGRELASFRFPITLQPWNHWRADQKKYHELASFVMPNQPYVSHIIEKATEFLRATAPHASFDGYHAADSRAVIFQVSALWSALLAENIKYLTLSPNYIDAGQRIMTPDLIARNKHGNCLDLSLLICACLERIGLSPCLVSVPGHIVAGVWLFPDYALHEAVSLEDAEIRNYTADENPVLMLMESTAMCEGLNFDAALKAADDLLKSNHIQFAVDIAKARKEGVRSVPAGAGNIPFHNDEEIKGCGVNAKEASRREGWERKLLDLSLRNVMLNLKPGKTIVPIRERNITSVVEMIKTNQLADVVGPPDKDNMELLKNLYRAARTSLEENGANTLFVSLGTLRWFDVDDPRPHVAPLLFVPVSIVRKKAMTYEVRLRDDEPMINVTLIEMLRQMLGVAFPELDQLPQDEDGFPDWRAIFDIFSEHIKEINKRQPEDRQWELPIQSFIGIFSFTKFLMWHDVHFHPDVIDLHPVLKGLMSNHFNGGSDSGESVDVRAIESESLLDLMMPVDYDSSQLEAVAECHRGQSFVLHGPPGTGKSQTITNIIADALYSGKRVLFVAEKKAALDVVKSRLNSIGLEPFCLELHSNKVDKRSFFSQVEKSYIRKLSEHSYVARKSQEYKRAAATLDAARRHLSDIADAIHSENDHGLSLYDCVNRMLSSGYGNLAVQYEDVNHLSPARLDELCAEFRSLDLVAEIMGYHPGRSDLVGLYPHENTSANQNAVTESLAAMPEAIAKARRKALSIFNKWFSKKSAEEILRNSEIWKRLSSEATVDADFFRDIDSLERSIKKWNTAVGDLRKWYHFSEKALKINDYNLPKAMDFYLKGASGSNSADEIHSSYYRAHAYHAIDNDSNLRGFSGRLHENSIERYRRSAQKFQNLSREELIRMIEEKIVKSSLSQDQLAQLAVLSRRVQTKGRGVALRKVIADAESILGILFPCMLMSPLSVAQYLDMKPGLFDIVIFDEASQMETPDAVGTIARGRSLVVVGDPLQLPPTRFFISQTSTGEDVEENEDSDSILEDCIAIGMKSHYLSRHYRSRHESLIAFSNCHFYGNRLLTFPSHNDSERKVRLIDPNGIYDYGKTRTNKVEAEAVVKYLLDLLEESPVSPSVGIVAFSKAQSNLIEDILNNKLQRNKALQKKLDEAEETLFIKNLENVQGDERDIIILSIGYGPDKNGNVSLNFGPINKIGGERRLNVAVSRARHEMVVFSSLRPNHIPAGDGAAKGVEALRNFLSYAIHGSIPQMQSADSEKEIIIEDIAEKLRQKGLEVATKVGRSSFKIDLAIVDKENPDNYKLGLIIDGNDYNALPTVRDREITVPAVLKSLGWRLHRLWTIDWLENPEAVVRSIMNKLETPIAIC